MDRATEQKSLDQSQITFDGTKPSFYKPYEYTEPTAGMIVVSIYHKRHYDEGVQKPIGDRQLSLMSSAGALTTGNVDKKNIGAFFQYRQTNTYNHVTKSWWNLELLKKLNPEDEAMHSTFDYVNLERNRYDYTKEWPKATCEGHVPIAIMTIFEKLLTTDCVTVEDYKERLDELRKEQEDLMQTIEDPRPAI